MRGASTIATRPPFALHPSSQPTRTGVARTTATHTTTTTRCRPNAGRFQRADSFPVATATTSRRAVKAPITKTRATATTQAGWHSYPAWQADLHANRPQSIGAHASIGARRMTHGITQCYGSAGGASGFRLNAAARRARGTARSPVAQRTPTGRCPTRRFVPQPNLLKPVDHRRAAVTHARPPGTERAAATIAPPRMEIREGHVIRRTVRLFSL